MRPTLSSQRVRAALWAAAAIATLSTWHAWPFVVDDAFVTFRYARNLVSGAGYGMNPGVSTDGVTGPLWVVPLALAGAVGAEIPGTARALGALLSMAAGFVLLWAMSARSGGAARWVSALFLALSGTCWVWASAGLETGAATFIMAVLVASVVRRMPWWAPLVALGALPSLRPDLVPAACLLSMHARDLPRRAALGAAVFGVAAVSVWRIVMFGTPVPLSVVAKGGTLANGFAYVLSGAALMSMGGGLYLAWRSRKRRAARWVAAALAVHLVVIALAGGDWMPGHRLLVPMLPALALLVGWGSHGFRRVSWVTTPTFVLMAAFSLLTLHEARGAGVGRETRGRALVQSLEAGPVALVDVGFVGWESELEVVDLGGITDPIVARMPGDHVDRQLDVAYLESRGASVFVLHSVTQPVLRDGQVANFVGYPTENRLIRSPWFQRSYAPVAIHPYAETYWYVRFERRESE